LQSAVEVRQECALSDGGWVLSFRLSALRLCEGEWASTAATSAEFAVHTRAINMQAGGTI